MDKSNKTDVGNGSDGSVVSDAASRSPSPHPSVRPLNTNMAGKQPKHKERQGVDSLGRTELHYAANNNEVEKARALIAEGACAHR